MTQAPFVAVQQARTRQLVWPREHGAWGLLLVPLATGAWVGACAGRTALPVLLFALATIAVFCLRTPVESLLGVSAIKVANEAERNIALRYAFLFGAVSTVSTAALWGGHLGLIALGGAAALLFAVQVTIKRAGRRFRMASQVIGALALTATAPGAYYVATGRFDLRAIGLWLAYWVFAGNQIHFVQLRLHSSKCGTWEEKFARGRGFFAGQTIMMLALTWAWAFGVLPALVLIAFVPVFVRGVAWFFSRPRPLALHRLGMTELAHAIGFGVLLVAALR